MGMGWCRRVTGALPGVGGGQGILNYSKKKFANITVVQIVIWIICLFFVVYCLRNGPHPLITFGRQLQHLHYMRGVNESGGSLASGINVVWLHFAGLIPASERVGPELC